MKKINVVLFLLAVGVFASCKGKPAGSIGEGFCECLKPMEGTIKELNKVLEAGTLDMAQMEEMGKKMQEEGKNVEPCAKALEARFPEYKDKKFEEMEGIISKDCPLFKDFVGMQSKMMEAAMKSMGGATGGAEEAPAAGTTATK